MGVKRKMGRFRVFEWGEVDEDGRVVKYGRGRRVREGTAHRDYPDKRHKPEWKTQRGSA